jgi:hypothetical protein
VMFDLLDRLTGRLACHVGLSVEDESNGGKHELSVVYDGLYERSAHVWMVEGAGLHCVVHDGSSEAPRTLRTRDVDAAAQWLRDTLGGESA